MAARRSQSHTNAELVGPLHHCVRDHAVESHRSQRQGQHGERGKQPRHQAPTRPFRLVFNPLFQVLDMALNLLVVID